MCVGCTSMLTASAVVRPPKPCGPMPRPLTRSQQIAFELDEIGPRVTSIDRPQYRALGKQRRSFERPADAHADDDRRTRVGAGAIDCFDDEVADALDSVRRYEHAQRAHVLRSEALRRDAEPQSIARDQLDVNRGRRGITSHLEPAGRIAGDRRTEITGARAFANAGMHGLCQRPTHEVNVLADVEHHDGHTAVLADRHAFGGRHFVVANELFQCLTSER